MNSFSFQKTAFLSILFWGFFLAPLGAFALSENDIALKITPETPAPLEEVTATLVSYAIDINRLPITWRVSGATVSSGVGKKGIVFQAPASGKTVSVVATITIGDTSITKSVSLSTGNIDILWETVDVSVPKFYQGKKLPSPESVIRVVALPQLKQGGVTLKQNALVYEWRRNGKLIPSASGYGKHTVTFTNSNLKKSEMIEVTATSFDGRVSAETRTTISVVNPFVLFYEESPLLGKRLEQAFGKTLSLSKEEIMITAEPYFFSLKGDSVNSLSYEWQMNGEAIDHRRDIPNSIVLRPEGTSGVAKFVLRIKNAEKILQKADNSISITY